MVGDGSYLMLNSELVTARPRGNQDHRRPRGQPRLPVHRRALRVGRRRTLRHELPDAATHPVNWPARNCPSTWRPTPRASAPRSCEPTTIDELRDALKVARATSTTTVIHIETDPMVAAPDSASWWDVPGCRSRRRATPRAKPWRATSRSARCNASTFSPRRDALEGVSDPLTLTFARDAHRTRHPPTSRSGHSRWRVRRSTSSSSA